MPRKYCSYRTFTRSSVLSRASSSSSTTSAFSGPCCPDFVATYRKDSSFCYSLVGRIQIMSILYFLLLVGVLVVIHELGHFAAAKLLDVKVLRFSIGYGRPLVRVKLRETEYQIGAFPLGGYVRILGIEGDDRAGDRGERSEPGARSDARRSFASRPLWQRLMIV